MQTEYKMETNVGDLKSIYINQRFYEDIKIDGILSQNMVDRKTNYHIYVLDEIPASDDEILFYNKTYLCAISISSECVNTQDEYCLPKKLVDFNDQDYSHVSRLRRLDELQDLEKIPLPLCLFNLTDNNVIKSITCHKNLSESKINSIVLDLYFFRPPGVMRPDMKGANITIKHKSEGDNLIIRETNGGLCEVQNPLLSFCSTDMNTTKDSKGNLLAYDEFAFTNITNNENNYYIKRKYTKLLDKTYTESLNPKKYNETLNKLYPKLENYMKYYEHFNLDNFKELYEVTKGIANKTKNLRNLYNEKPTIVNNDNLFNFTHFGGVQILLNLKDNAGYNTQTMEAFNILEIDNEKIELANVKQFSDIDKVITNLITLSRAGNNLATELYQKIKDNLNNITDIITINIPNINNLVVYKELSEIFDSTYSLRALKIIPFQIVEESNDLINKLEKLFTGIENGSLKKNISILNDYIYKFIKESHILVNKIYNNLKELGELIKSPKQTISDISTYYMNHTSTSYINTIQEAEKILMHYYIDERDLIIPEVENILKQFEELTIESLKKQLNLILNLKSKIGEGNITINNANEEDYKKIIINFENSNYYINKTIELFKNKVRNEMNLKNDYFISKYDIESNNETFSKLIEESLAIAQSLDDNEYIDKTFDSIMTNFRQSFTNIIKDMDEKKIENFPMDENTLQGEYFKSSEQENISKELKELSVKVYTKIKNENNEYLNMLKDRINKFLENNKDYLDSLIKDLESLFSEEKVEYLADIYNMTFKEYLNQITNTINKDKDLAKTYFDGMFGVMTNNNDIIKLLKNYPVDKTLPPNHPCVDPEHCWQYTSYEDLIYNKYITQGYLNKYNIYKAKFESSKNYISEELNTNILQEYKNIISKIKGVLQSFKNNKMSDKYPEYIDFQFIDKHLNDVDNLYNRLNKYISDDKFNKYYFLKIRDYKNKEIKEINNIKKYIEDKHKTIYSGRPENDFNNDFCTTFKRRKTYTCTNSAVYVYEEDDKFHCLYSWGYDYYNKLKIPSFTSNTTLKNKFNEFYNPIKDRIYAYNKKIEELKEIIASSEKETKNKNITLNYLSPIKEKVNSILSEKYSNNLIRASYNYYKNILDERLENLLTNASNKWIDSFDILSHNVNKSMNDFKFSMNEFGLMALIYEAVISQNLTRIFYNSIIEHQKSEFNYTISYYYNVLSQNLTAAYQYIFNQIPRNQEGFNNILDLRKKQVNETFNELFKNIEDSKSDSLSLNKQIYVIGISSSNFFNTNSILSKINDELRILLKYKGTVLFRSKNGKQNNEFSLACRFYLENSINGLQIEEIYEPINENIFVYLNLRNFKKILSDHWIFDQDDFIKRLNMEIYNSNLDISQSILEKQNSDYYIRLEKEITKFYTKESIAEKISKQFKTQIKDINNDMKLSIKQNIQEILNKIKNNISKEVERLKTTATSFTNNFTQINNTIKNYKENIINKLSNGIINQIVYDFYDNMINIAYIGRIESGLNSYLSKAEEYNSTCDSYESLYSTYNIGEIIYKIVRDLTIDFKNITKNHIEFKRKEYIEKLNKQAGIEDLKKLIEDELGPYFSNLLNALKKIVNNNSGDKDYTDYDFNDEIKNDINSLINENMEKINNTIIKIKGEKFKVDLYGWDILDYDKVNVDTFDPIKTNFESFIEKKIDNEKNNINNLLKKIIRNNFNVLINNLIFSFGNEFFDRVINYNENFKITSLYQNLKYSLVLSLQYYSILYGLRKDINSLTKDLKIKLYNLNNLDLIADEKNKKVINLLSENADEFIEESMQYLIKNYKLYLNEDTSIQLAFNEKIRNSIASNLEDIRTDLEKDYTALLNEQFKKRLINSYTKVMNAQTNEMIQTVNDLKEEIRSIFDDLFSLDIEKVLTETNNKMNDTLESIKEYNTFFNSFKIPDKLINFLNNYGFNIIQPNYKGIEELLNKETKSITIQNLEKNSKDFENTYKIDNFIEQRDKTYKLIKNDNIDIINNQINSYGRTENEYYNILENEINRIYRRNLRRLNEEGTENDILEEYREKVADKSIDDNFHKLLNSSQNTISFVQTFEYFDKFEDKLEKYLKKLNMSYKESQDTIDNIYKEDDVYGILNEKLHKLNNIGLNYYSEIKESFNSLKKFIVDSLNDIDSSLIECANSTYKTFDLKYEQISNDSEAIDKEIDTNIDEINDIEHKSVSSNTEYITTTKIESLIKKARFKFSLITDEDGDIKRPKVKASVINQIRPKSLTFEISSPFGACGKNIQRIEIDFNNVNYTTDLNFDTQSTLINVTTITDFDSYQYKVQRYKVENSNDIQCKEILGITVCVYEECESTSPIKVGSPSFYIGEKKTKKETVSIDG